MTYKIVAVTLFFLLLSFSLVAQEQNDSLISNVPVYPRIKFFTLSYDQGAKSDYKISNSQLSNNEGSLTRGRLQVMGTLPVWKKKKFTLSITELYTREILSVIENTNPTVGNNEQNYGYNNFITTINGSYIGTLFKKPFISNASIIVGSENFIQPEKVSGIVSGMLIFQKKPQTRFGLGLIGLVDPSSQIPAFPIFTYWHRFKNPTWELDVIMPSTVKLRKSNILGGWMSTGMDFNAFGYFLTDLPNTSKTYQNNYSELSFSLSYERIFAKNYMISIQGGYKKTLQNRIGEVYQTYNNSSISIDIKETPFIKAGISFILPNEKIKQKTHHTTKQKPNVRYGENQSKNAA